MVVENSEMHSDKPNIGIQRSQQKLSKKQISKVRMISFGLSITICAYMILSNWQKLREDPVAVTIDDKSSPISQVPFPGVTICPPRKYNRKMDVVLNTLVLEEPREKANISEAMAYINEKSVPSIIDYIDAILHTCPDFAALFARSLLKNDLFLRNASIYQTLSEMGPQMSEVIEFATLSRIRKEFHPVITGDGLCFTFNSLNSRDFYTNAIAEDLITVVNNRDSSNWNIDDGYASQTNAVELYPYRVFGSGSRDSMHVRLFIPVKNEPMACRDFEQGARLWLHAPDSLPQISDHYINIPIEQDISISVKPIMTKTLAGTLSSYSLHRRNCYFHSERRLRFFKIYNQKNCELECLANYTNSVCKCVKFYMPRDDSTTVCNTMDIKCYLDAENEFVKMSKVTDSTCDCLPECNALSYDMELFQAPRKDTVNYPKVMRFSRNRTSQRIHISFKGKTFIAHNRKEAYSFVDVITNCGGLLGIFMGISLLSVIEIIYYFMLRLIYKIKQRKPLQRMCYVKSTGESLDDSQQSE